MLNIILKNGLICDGSGTTKPFVGDIAVKNGIITEIAPHIDAEAETILDVSGLIVSPAFIDVHSHSDSSFLEDEKCESKIYQGVATEVVGQCGSSLFPRSRSQLTNAPEDSYQSGSFEKLLKKVDGKKMSTNLVQLVGHNAIRRGVVGLLGRPSGFEENQLSSYLLEQNLEQGAWGLSLGLEYMPGIFSDLNELIQLGKICYKYNVPITSHMRNEGAKVYESLDEMIEINRQTGAQIHIAHLKIADKSLWGTAEKLYNRILEARKNGVNITADVYPYNACSTGISRTLPAWAMEGGTEGATNRLSSKEKDDIYAHLCENYPTKADGDRVYIISTNGRYPLADDKTAGELSEELGISVPDTLMKILIETRCRANCIFFNMDEGDAMYLLGRGDISIGSDASARPYDPSKNSGKPHPRAYGTFPRFLRLRRENNFCSLETAISRITKIPAEILAIKDRGRLAPGLVADITVFDEKRISDTATFSNPFQKPIGIVHLIIDGKFALKSETQTNERLGKYLLK